MESERREARFWHLLENEVIRCDLCPHYCEIKPGKLGLCKTRSNDKGTLYTKNYGKVVSYAYDPIEKKPLRDFYPGSTIFSIGTYGCNLTCKFCQNHALVNFEGPVIPTDSDQLMHLAVKNNSIGIAYTYNEPTVWYEFVLDTSKKAHELGLKNVLVTNGYINEAPLLELLPYIDAMNIDLKGMTDSFYRTLCGGSLHPVLKAIEICAAHTHVEVTTLLIDGLNTNSDEIEALAKWLACINPDIPLHLSRYFPAHELIIPKTRLETLLNARNIAEKYLNNVYIGNAFI